MIDTQSRLSVIRKVAALARVLPTFEVFLSGWTRTSYGGSGIVHWWIVEPELLKLQKSGQFPDDPERIIV